MWLLGVACVGLCERLTKASACLGEFQYPKTDSFAGAAEHCTHNSHVQSWSDVAKEAPERVVIGGYESGMDATSHLTAAGVNVTVVASTPFWEHRTLDPSTELSPFTAGRLKLAQKTPNPPTLMSYCKVVKVAPAQDTDGYTLTVERRPATGDNTRDRKPTALVSAKAPATAAADGPTVMIVAEPEVFELSSAAKPILATGFHSGATGSREQCAALAAS